MVDTCLVTGTIVAPDGTPVRRTAILFQRTPKLPFIADDASAFPAPVTARTGADGSVEVELIPGTYLVKPWYSTYEPFRIVVPDEPSARLEDIQFSDPPPPLTDAELAVLQAREARDEAREARDEAEGARNEAQAAAQEAEAAADRAEAARDAAQLNAHIYPDTAAGLAATTDGDYFSVPSESDDEYLILYRNDNGSATEVRRYPSASLVTALSDQIDTFEGEVETLSDTIEVGRVNASNKFASLGEDYSAGFAIVDTDGGIIAGFDEFANPVLSAGALFESIERDLPDAALILVDENNRLVDPATFGGSGFDEFGNPILTAGVLFESIDRELPDAALILVDENNRLVDPATFGGSAAMPQFDSLPSAPPVDESSKYLPWRDGPYLAIRDPLEQIYTADRQVWFTGLATLYGRYDDLVADYPDYISRESLGQDALGNELYQYTFYPTEYRRRDQSGAVPISPEEMVRPKVIVTSGTHGSERAGQMGVLTFAWQLAHNWRRRPEYRRLRFGAKIVIIPAACPSGVDAGTRYNHNGVDINRNFDWRWGEDPSSSTEPGGLRYPGPSPASEAETQILQTLTTTIHPDAVGVVDRHSGSQRVVWIGNGHPASLPHLIRMAERLEEDFWRLAVNDSLDLPEFAEFTNALPGSSTGYWGDAGVPAFFIEARGLHSDPIFNNNLVGHRQFHEYMTLRSVETLLAIANHGE